VHRAAKRDRTRLPSRLEQPPAISVPKHVSAVWTFGLGGTPKTGSYWTVNGKPFDPKRVDHVVRRGSTQTWLLRNMSPITHFIHIHEEQWHTVSRDGKPPPAWERGLEDTWRLDPGERVKVAAKFTDYTGVFMLHCHMLAHEDHGMMAQFAVVKRDATHLPAGYYLTSGRYGGAQSEHATSASASASASMPMPMDMDMPMTAAMRKSTGLPALPASNQQAGSTSLLARDLSRWGRALALELAALVLLLGWRRYRPQARLGGRCSPSAHRISLTSAGDRA
jgi:hypothetical protein